MKRVRSEATVARRGHRLWLWLIAASAVAFGAGAATNGFPPYSLRLWQTDDGLPQNSVYALAQTTDGFLWVGTRDGLVTFDGVHFRAVEARTAPELKRGWITALCAGRDGSLWIGCDGAGVFRLKSGAFSHLTEANGLPGNQPRCFREGRDGTIWIGSEGGLSRYQHGKITNFFQRDGLGDNSIRSLWEDRRGVLRIATKRGLSRLQGRSLKTLNIGSTWNANALRCVCEDRQGRLWVGSTDGLTCLDGTNRVLYNVAQGLPDRVINTLYEQPTGELWVGTYGGLARIAEGRVLAQPERESVFGDLIYTVLEDQEGDLWVGARDGLYRLKPSRFTIYTTEQGLSGNNVMSVFEDREGVMWLGIWGGGLDSLSGGKVASFGAPGLLRDAVLSLGPTSDGGIWVGMDLGGGLQRFRGGVRSVQPKEGGWGTAPISVIHEDRQGALWVGTAAGLQIMKGGNFQAYSTTNGLAGDAVLAICEDDEGSLWIGTEGGLSRYRDGKFTNYTTKDGLSYNAVNAVYVDRQKSVWLGTRAGGLNRFQNGKFTAYTDRQGLFSDEVYEILEDDSGYLWMSCRRGIFRVAKQDFDELDRGSLKNISCTAFGKADGLLSVQCNGVAKPAGWKGHDGRLWFPTIRGVVAVDSKIKTNDRPPPVVIQEVLVDNKLLPIGQAEVVNRNSIAASPRPLMVAPGRGELEIRYTALSLQAPEKNRFKYKLEPVDLDWRDAESQRAAQYNNLAPGAYHFRVLACNNDGVWNENGATLALVLQPHYWQTWWFKVAGAALAVLVLTLLYRSRVARLRELERLRVEIAANLHDDVGARLTKVAMITELVEHDTPATHRLKPQVQAIFNTTREVIQAMDEIVWTINPKNDTLENLANYVFQYAQEYFQHTGVRCRLDMPTQLPELAISTKLRHNLFMAIKEALSNALKHAGASEVHVGLTVNDSLLTVTVVDDGRGFAPEKVQHVGNGLDNMKTRLEQVGGRMLLESVPGQGATVRLEAAVG